MTIWKFQIGVYEKQGIPMPKGAQIISVAEQYGVMCLWAVVDENQLSRSRQIRIFGTGHPFNADNEPLRFIGTVQVCGFVWHVYEVVEQ